MKAARQDDGLIPLLLIKESLVQPTLSLEQIKQLPLGLVNFLIARIREISGLSEKKSNCTWQHLHLSSRQVTVWHVPLAGRHKWCRR